MNTVEFCAGDLAHALRFLASVVSQSFLAFGDILELHKKFLELTGGINRVFELEELLDAAQHGESMCFYFACFREILLCFFLLFSSHISLFSNIEMPLDLLSCSFLIITQRPIYASTNLSVGKVKLYTEQFSVPSTCILLLGLKSKCFLF